MGCGMYVSKVVLKINNKSNKEEIMAGEDKNNGKAIQAACEAYGIDPKYVLSSYVDPNTGEVVIVTQGGMKVRYKAGDKVEPLDPITVSGINSKNVKKKVVAGKAKE